MVRARGILAACGAISLMVAALLPAAADPLPLTARLQQIVDDYLARRKAPEDITGVALRVSLGNPGPIVQAFAGTLSKDPGAGPMADGTLFQIGSNTKVFTSVLILKLEAMGLLDIHQTLGHWLPQYPAWKNVTIESLLNMTAPIPTYSEAPAMSAIEAADDRHQWRPEELVAFAYPKGGAGDLPPPREPWFYSNTNYILAGMIAAVAGKDSYDALLEKLVIAPLGLSETVIGMKALPPEILARLASGYFANDDCLLYEPNCKVKVLAPLMGKDMKTNNLSWAGAAGAIVSSLRDETAWIRALFAGEVLPPRQMAELLSLVSLKTGRPIADTGKDDPRAFSLGLARQWDASVGGSFWFYEGETLGYRVIFAYLPKADLVITLTANSQPLDDQLGPTILAVVAALRETGTIAK